MSYNFFSKSDITFGRGTLDSLSELVRSNGWSKPMIIYDRGLASTGITERVIELVTGVCENAVEFDGVIPNPTNMLVEEATKIAHNEKVDSFIAVGGGSSIDLAKAVNVLFTNGGTIGEYGGVGKVKNPLLPLVAIPTTAGTSSEITNVSALLDTQSVVKYVIIDNKLTPDYVIADPELTLSMPLSVTAGTGMDAITHALESYISNMANPLSEYHSLKAFQILCENFPKVVEDGSNIDAREQMMLGCIIAGYGFSNANLGLVHGIAHTLSAHFGMAHGLANAAVLPHVMAFNAPAVPEKMLQLAKAIGLRCSGNMDEDILLVAKEMGRFNILADIKPLSAYGIRNGDILMLAEETLKEPVLGFNPRAEISKEDVVEILRKAY